MGNFFFFFVIRYIHREHKGQVGQKIKKTNRITPPVRVFFFFFFLSFWLKESLEGAPGVGECR